MPRITSQILSYFFVFVDTQGLNALF